MNKKIITLIMSLILCFFFFIKLSIEPLFSLIIFISSYYLLNNLDRKDLGSFLGGFNNKVILSFKALIS